MEYRIRTKVKTLEFKKRAVKVTVDKTDPENPEITWWYEDIGFFVRFEGSHEALFVGVVEPKDLQTGAEVDIIIRPVEG